MSTCKYNVGDEVDMKPWDRSERPVNRMGVCIVVRTERVRNCESGWMITVRSLDRRDRAEMRVDSNWPDCVSRVQTMDVDE